MVQYFKFWLLEIQILIVAFELIPIYMFTVFEKFRILQKSSDFKFFISQREYIEQRITGRLKFSQLFPDRARTKK